MSPDIHWHVGEDAEQETIAKTTPTRRSRRSWIAIVIVVILGASLGMVYRSLPEPAPRPTPTPVPTGPATPTRPAMSVALYQTIDREAQALADGDYEIYRDVHAMSMQDKVIGERKSFAAWGHPGDDRPVYEIVDFNLLSDTSAWVDVRQFREGRYFRETRFYYPTVSDRWLHGSPNDALWNGEEENLQTPHFNVTYAVKDRSVLSPTLNQLEKDYQSLCRDLGCATLRQELTFTVRMKADKRPSAYPEPSSGLIEEIQLPSPRVAGFFESGRAYSWNTSAAHVALAKAIVERVYGSISFDQPGDGLLYAGSHWALERIDPLAEKYFTEWGDLTHKPLFSLETLWVLRGVEPPRLALIQLNRLLRFVEQKYGAAAVTQLLGAIGSAKSLSDAIENGLGVSFTEFDQKWQAWLKQTS